MSRDSMQPTLVSLVFRIDKEKLDAVKALAKDTRITQSNYLREAVADVLMKHADELKPGGES